MRAIWSGTARSSSRIDRVTGAPTEYRMVIYDNGQASCTCPSFLFSGLRNPSLSDDEKLRFRCKHLVLAFKAQQTPQLARAAQASGDPPASDVMLAGGTAATPPRAPDPEPDLFDDDDDEYIEPRVRR